MTTERIKEIQSKTDYPESVSVQQALLQVWNECEQEQLRLHNVRLSLPDAKQAVAEMYSKEDWAEVLKDYEYGLGISKMIGFEELMDKVAEVYKGNEA